MALQQSALMSFLYESWVPTEDAAIPPIPSDVVADLLPTLKGDESDDIADSSGSNVSKPVEPATSLPSDNYPRQCRG
jgi:hypothetical protein